MRTPITTLLAGAALLAIAACSSGGGVRNAAPVRAYGPEAGTTATGTRAPALVPGTYVWNSRLADAQAQARATGKLILVSSTKPGCTLCEKFKNQTVPAVAAEASAMSVGYAYDITRPEVREIDQILRANLEGASLMPLIGFLTADLQWVDGFWGARTVQQFRADIANAARKNPRRTASLGPLRTVGDDRTLAAVTNEFGEPEWSLPGDVWPAGDDPTPIDAIRGSPALPDMQPADPTGATPMLADATPVPAPAAGLAPLAPLEVPGATPLAPPPAPSQPAPPSALPPMTAVQPSPPRVADATVLQPPPRAVPVARPAEPAPWTGPQDDTSPALPPAGPAVAPRGAVVPPLPIERRWSDPAGDAPAETAAPAVKDWGRQALERAYQQIEGARYDAARHTLAEVQSRYPDTSLAREASKGSIALYNAKRIRTADSESEKERYRSRARRDLATSMWSSLFSS
jgi:hypothetical protein